MSDAFSLPGPLPAAAQPAVQIVRDLTAHGHTSFLAGGCVRDLLLGRPPQDYDVATDASPERVCALFRAARKVGAQFGVVLVRKGGRWVEVATFRTDGTYADGRHPQDVQFSDARHDALRRDFTVNGMFLDPLTMRVIDYVGGQADLSAHLVRAIGDPERRFDEDHLRLLRAVRFAARLGFEIENGTLAAIRRHARKLLRIAPERVREELEKILAHPSRRRAFQNLLETGLLYCLWNECTWTPDQTREAGALLERLAAAAPFELVFAALVADRAPAENQRIGRALTFSNEQRETVVWLVEHQGDLDEPAGVSLAELKRRMVHPAFGLLQRLVLARYQGMPDGPSRAEALARRLSAIDPRSVAPSPLVTGHDLLARGVASGPAYGEILDELYTRQLNEQVGTREQALQALDAILAARASGRI